MEIITISQFNYMYVSDSASIEVIQTKRQMFWYDDIYYKAPIDRPISQESSGDPNLVGDPAARSLRSLTLIVAPHAAAAAAVWIELAPPHLSDSQVAAIWAAHVNSVSPTPSPLPRRRLGSSDHLEQRW